MMANCKDVPQVMRVGLIEGDSEIRETLLEALKSDNRFQPEMVFTKIEGVCQLLGDVPGPDIVILDLDLPGTDAIDGVSLIRVISPQSRILVLTGADNKDGVVQALGVGASGYLFKSAGVTAILQGIDEAFGENASLTAASSKA